VPEVSVSVVCPFRGNVAWLEEAVRSALEQTLPPLEVIVASQSPLEETAHLAKWDERIRIVPNDGVGAAAGRNHGIREARGDLIAFLDADDVFLPTKFERQIPQMVEQRAAFSHTSYERMSDDGTTIDTISSGAQSGAIYPEILVSCRIATPTVVVRRELLGSDPFRPSPRFDHDTLLWIVLARRTPFLGIDEPLTRIRVHGRNQADDPSAQILAWTSVLEVALPADPHLPPQIRRQTQIVIYETLAMLERRRGRRLASARARLRALVLSLPSATRRSASRRYMRMKVRGARVPGARRLKRWTFAHLRRG
jgi:glycosyltransferase involved in cell wall biosynthesis